MLEDLASEERDLRNAAEIFLRGPVRVGSRAASGVEIGAEAVTRVAALLAACEPRAVADIRSALHWHRRVCTTASREDVIDAVTAAVALRDLTDNGRAPW